MELRHLRYYVAVAEEENVSRAALALHVSQPALSRQIRDLEDELGFLLLDRGAKSVSLTDAGRVFLKEARAVLQHVDEAVEKARAFAQGGGGELHVGYAPSLTAQILPRTLRAFQSEYRGMKVFLHDLTTEEMTTGLRNGSLQLAFFPKPTRAMLRSLSFQAITQSPYCAAVAAGHPFTKHKSITLAQLVEEPLIGYERKGYPEYHDELVSIFAPTGRKPRIVGEYDSVTSLIAGVESGAGASLVPDVLACLAGQRLKLIPIKPAPEPLCIGVAWSKEGLIPAASRFVQLALDTRDV